MLSPRLWHGRPCLMQCRCKLSNFLFHKLFLPTPNTSPPPNLQLRLLWLQPSLDLPSPEAAAALTCCHIALICCSYLRRLASQGLLLVQQPLLWCLPRCQIIPDSVSACVAEVCSRLHGTHLSCAHTHTGHCQPNIAYRALLGDVWGWVRIWGRHQNQAATP